MFLSTILGLQPRDKVAMLVVTTKEIFLLNLHQNRVHFPVERNAFVHDHQHGCRDITCRPAILQNTGSLICMPLSNNSAQCNVPRSTKASDFTSDTDMFISSQYLNQSISTTHSQANLCGPTKMDIFNTDS